MEKEYKTVFDIDGLPRSVPSYSQFYQFHTLPAKYIYRGIYKPWLTVPASTIANQNFSRIPYQFNIAKALCSTLAQLEWAEQATVKVDDGTEASDLNAYVQSVLKDNRFYETMPNMLELVNAEGGGAIKIRVDGVRKEDGSMEPGTEKIILDFAQADQFVPTAWSFKSASEGFFITRQAYSGWYYTLLEWHKWNGSEYHIENQLYKSMSGEQRKNGAKPTNFAEAAAATDTSQDILGFRSPLAELYPLLAEDSPLDISHGMFVYMRTPMANNVDMDSPLGISTFANAIDTLHGINILSDSLIQEIRLGKKRLIVPASAIQTASVDGTRRRYFNADDEVYEALSSDNIDALKVIDMSQELRVDQIVAAINAELNILCLQTGLNQNTFSFSTDGGVRTATEVIAENSKTYTTIRAYQNAVKPAIEELIHQIIEVACYYDLSFNGKSVRSMANEYKVLVQFDDSVLEDSQSKRNNALNEVAKGLMSKKTYLMQYRNLTETEADAELERIADESNVRMRDINALPTE